MVDPTVTIVVVGDASPTFGFRSSPLLSTLLLSPLTLLVSSDLTTAPEAVAVEPSLLEVVDISWLATLDDSAAGAVLPPPLAVLLSEDEFAVDLRAGLLLASLFPAGDAVAALPAP